MEQVATIRKHALSLILENITHNAEVWSIGLALIVMRAGTILAPVQNFIQRGPLSVQLEKTLVVHVHAPIVE